MKTMRLCKSCGGPLPPDAPEGLCPKCLLQKGIESTQGDSGSAGSLPAGPPKTIQVSLPPDEQTGDRIGPYKLLQKIGEGGFGAVYMADQIEPVRRRVALKVIKLGMDTKQVIARFEAERQALAMMDHPNIAKVLDAGTTETGRPYFVMELVRGIKITEYCDQNNLATQERLELFQQVCHAIQHAHQKGIIHRDVKPSNILVTLHDGVPVPKVIDFGVAKATQQPLTDKTLFTAYEQVIGTPAYMSPEQAEMSGMDIDTRSDIYSLGVLLYELLTGRLPFEAKELLQAGLDEMRRMIREQDPPKPSTRLSTLADADLTNVAKHRDAEPPKLISLIRGDLDWIVMKALEKDRTRRYETANGLAQDIQRFLLEEPVLAVAPSAWYQFRKFARRHQGAFAAATAIVVLLVGGIIVSTWQARRAMAFANQANTERLKNDKARREADKARGNETVQRQRAERAGADLRQNLYAADIRLAQDALQNGNLALAKTLLATYQTSAGQEDLRGFEWHYFWRICNGNPHAELSAHSNIVSALAFSPDGRWLASGSWDHRVLLWDLARRQVDAELPNSAYAKFCSLAFFGRTSHLVVGGDQGATILRGETWAKIWRTNTFPCRVASHPEGKLLAVSVGGGWWGGDASVLLLEPSGGPSADSLEAWHLLRSLPNAGDLVQFTPDGRSLVTAGSSGTRFWDLATGVMKRHLPAPKTIFALALSADGRFLATTSAWDTTIQLWDLATSRPIGQLQGHSAMVWTVAFAPKTDLLASGSSDQTVRLWNVTNQTVVTVLQGHANEVWSAAFSPDGSLLATGDKDGKVFLWPAPTELATPAETEPMVSLWPIRPVLSPDGSWFVAGTPDNTCAQFDLATGWQLREFDLERAALACSADGAKLVTLDRRGSMRLIEMATERVVATNDWVVKNGLANGRVATSRDGLWVAVAADSGRASVWEIKTLTLKAELPGEGGRLSAVDFSPDNRLLALGRGYNIEIWQIQSRQLLHTLPGHKDEVSGVVFNPEGSRLVSCSSDGTVRIWDTAKWDQTALIRAHREGITGLAVSFDGKTIASGGNDGTVRLWHMATLRELAAFSFSKQWHERGTLYYSSQWQFLEFAARDQALVAAPLRGPVQVLPATLARTRQSEMHSERHREIGRQARRPRSIAIPPRDAKASRNLVDLTIWYNAGLAQNFHGDAIDQNDLREIPIGLQTLAGVPFDIRGLIQLNGGLVGAYSNSVGGIKVGRPAKRLHFLQGSGWSETAGKIIGEYVIHFTDGQEYSIPLIYGKNLRDWWVLPPDDGHLEGAVIAWKGMNPATRLQRASIQLYKFSWDNPLPALAIDYLDFHSRLTRSAPFLVAITAE